VSRFENTQTFISKRGLCCSKKKEEIQRYQNEIRSGKMENQAAYWKLRYDLKQKHRHQFALISNKKLVSVFPDHYSAIIKKDELNDDYAFITQIGAEDKKPDILPIEPSELGKSTNHSVMFNQEDLPPHLYGIEINENDFIPLAYYIGPNRRPYVVLPLKMIKSSTKVLPTTFLVDTGSPRSYLEEKTIAALDLDSEDTVFEAWLNGKSCEFYKSSNHFSNINLLGTDIIYNHDLHVCHPMIEFTSKRNN